MSDSLITKKAIAQCLKNLAAEKSFLKISIGDITAACGLNRQTFYYHFQDKYELLDWIYYEECFVTNSLMGVMPVRQIGNICFPHRTRAEEVRTIYESEKMSL